jgi:hypothetical protein
MILLCAWIRARHHHTSQPHSFEKRHSTQMRELLLLTERVHQEQVERRNSSWLVILSLKKQNKQGLNIIYSAYTGLSASFILGKIITHKNH